MSDKKQLLKNKIKQSTPAREFIKTYTENDDSESVGNDTTDSNVVQNNNINFDSNSNINNDINKDDVDDTNNNIDENNENDINVKINSILFEEEEKPKKEFVGFYLDSDVNDTLNKLSKKGRNKKGKKSQIVNDILRSVLEQQGLLKKD